MRVLTVVLALVAIPFVAGVSQAPMQDPKNCGAHLTPAEKANARGSRAGEVLAHGGKHGVMDRPCAPAPEPEPEPAACAVSAPAPTGADSITGWVQDGAQPWGPLAGWCIHLTGTVTATAMTDANGYYRFTGLPNGTYTVCEVMQSGWQQTFPSLAWGALCPGDVAGWPIPLAGWSSTFTNFNNIVAP